MTKPGKAKGAGAGSPPTKEEARAHRLRWVTTLQGMAGKTANPLYVWDAILTCLTLNEPLPEWCNSYLLHTAIELAKLKAAVAGEQFIEPAPEIPMKGGEAVRAVPLALQIKAKSNSSYDAFRGYASDQVKIRDAGIMLAAKVAPESIKNLPNYKPGKDRIAALHPGSSEVGHLVRRQVSEGMKLSGASHLNTKRKRPPAT
jgi:hypothetical protein